MVVALRYLATNAHQNVQADTIGVSQKTISNVVKKLVKALNHPIIVKKFIQCWPNGSKFFRRSAENFACLGRLSNIIRVYGSCMKVDKPLHSRWQFYSRKRLSMLVDDFPASMQTSPDQYTILVRTRASVLSTL